LVPALNAFESASTVAGAAALGAAVAQADVETQGHGTETKAASPVRIAWLDDRNIACVTLGEAAGDSETASTAADDQHAVVLAGSRGSVCGTRATDCHGSSPGRQTRSNGSHRWTAASNRQSGAT